MTTKEKTAAISTGLNVILTIAKFFLFFITGSLAILAEAWHSFSDVGTSALVYLVVHLQHPNADKPDPESKPDTQSTITLEYWVSLGIGLFLLFIAISLIYKVITTPRVFLDKPILSGVLFLAFSIGSYFVFKFETSVGQEKGSVALVSDGLHSKADMIAAALTGFSLILYRLGIDIDKPIAILIGLFILSFAVETLIQFLHPTLRENPERLGQLRSSELIAAILDPKIWHKWIRCLDALLGSPLAAHPTLKYRLKLFSRYLLFIPVIAYLTTCFIMIRPNEEGIRLRFGQAVTKSALQSGLHLKFPWPFESIQRLESHRIRVRNIGNISDNQAFALLWTRMHGTEEPFLSGDNNYFYPYLVIHYRIKDIFLYEFQHTDAESILDNITYQIITEIFANNTFYDIATSSRGALIKTAHRKIQTRLDEMKTGILVLTVNMKDTHPPVTIADSFEDVIAAFQEKEKLLNDAFGYQNQQLPEANGEAARVLAGARAHVLQRKHHALGDSSRFIHKLEARKSNPRLVDQEFYFSSLKDALQNRNLVVIDPRAGDPQMWMNFEQLPGFSAMSQGEK